MAGCVSPDFTTKLIQFAPAKINLFLKVVRKRSDGYHDLYTMMQKLDLCDRIELQLKNTPGIQLRCSIQDIPSGPGNLAWKAAEAFLRVCGKYDTYGVELYLEKQIPSAAGLGGGSSDAGAVITGMNTLLGTNLAETELIALGKTIGADVPLFVTEHNAVIAEGIGEILTPVPPLSEYIFLLVHPNFPVSTKMVFDNFALTGAAKTSTLLDSMAGGLPNTTLSEMENELECVTELLHPEIAEIKKKLIKMGAVLALMSGSGPTVFGVFPKTTDRNSIESSMLKLQEEHDCKVFVTHTWAGASPSGKGTGF